jgi:hypothetical protein
MKHIASFWFPLIKIIFIVYIFCIHNNCFSDNSVKEFYGSSPNGMAILESDLPNLRTTQIYRDAENNAIADGICRAIKFMNMIIIPVSAIMFSVIGISAFQGNLKWSIFVTFAIGIGAFKAAGTILELFVPGVGLHFNCSCATYKRMRILIQKKNSTVQEWKIVDVKTGLDEDCNRID